MEFFYLSTIFRRTYGGRITQFWNNLQKEILCDGKFENFQKYRTKVTKIIDREIQWLTELKNHHGMNLK